MFRRLYRFASFLLLAVFAAGLTGMPMAKPSAVVEGRYPCENCACGCSTAEFCWDKCCCHSDAEKLQWARENGVEPPTFLVARLSKATTKIASVGEPASKSCCCCSNSTGSATCEASEAEETRLTSPESSSNLRIVLLEDSAKCRGIQWLWSVLSSTTVEKPRQLTPRLDPPFLFCVAICNDDADTRSDAPEPPVPWRAASSLLSFG
ncbi:hypothetical protein [Novipirellula aureliae]|uniref:hypothetical protein n=1 Tax=Novipirellula aureliae TaxID=2527966 RepID=UPI0011B60893|nr:hypothetical protein [Novipirellula aureliae]